MIRKVFEWLRRGDLDITDYVAAYDVLRHMRDEMKGSFSPDYVTLKTATELVAVQCMEKTQCLPESSK